MNYPTAVLMPAKRAAIEIRCGDPIVIHPGSLKKTPVDAEMDFRLREIVDKRALTPLFQPVVDLAHGKVVGYEGLIRGPSNSPLHSPVQLFRAAALCNRSIEVEHLCRRITLEGFSRMNLSGDLFLNVSPECLLHPDDERYGETLCSVHELGIDPQRVIIELTEHQPAYDYEQMRHAVRHYRSLGFRIAIDDLGEGFSSLRLWSELRPEFVKIDMHFIQGCNTDSVKKQFLRSIQEIARNSGSQVIAEGIETASELDCIQDIGIARGQGYFFARPAAAPSASISGDAASAFTRRPGMSTRQRQHAPSVSVLLRSVTPVPSSASTEEVYTVFDRDMDLPSLPVVDNGVPCGIIGRHALIDRLARPFRRELFGRKPCHLFMNRQPLLVECKRSARPHTLTKRPGVEVSREGAAANRSGC